MSYELYYWPSIQGRGEFIRLALEDAAAPYVDVAREPNGNGMGMAAMMAILDSAAEAHPPFAPPFLKTEGRLIAQTANILFFLGTRLGLISKAESPRLWAHQLQLTIADLLTEIHDTHHPIASGLYYEDQKPEARRRAADFTADRLPKFLDYFEQVLERNPGGDRYLVGRAHSYVDLSMFQIMAGLRYAFPRTLHRIEAEYPRLLALHARVAQRPNIAAYLASDRRIAFNHDGIFRHYKELD